MQVMFRADLQEISRKEKNDARTVFPNISSLGTLTLSVAVWTFTATACQETQVHPSASLTPDTEATQLCLCGPVKKASS